MRISILRAASVGAIGGAAAYLAYGPAAPYGAQLFALLIGWAAYSRLGGKLDGVKQAVLNLLLGVALAGLAFALATRLPFGETLGVAAWTAIAAAITLAALDLASRLPVFGAFPVALLGYATLLAAAAAGGGVEKIVALTPDNPLVLASLSLIVGALLGLVVDALVEAADKHLPLRRAPTQTATSA